MMKNQGFNLIELNIGLLIITIILFFTISSFSFNLKNFYDAINYLKLNSVAHNIFNQFNQEISNIGQYGCYNAKKLNNLVNTTTVEPLNFDGHTIGVRSYLASNAPSEVFSGISVDSTASILKLQYGTGHGFYHSSTTFGTNYNNIKIIIPIQYGIDPTNRYFVLSNCTQAYQLYTELKKNDQGYDLNLNNFNIAATMESGITMQLTEFHTKYYFVATIDHVHGLYIKYLQNNGALSAAILLSDLVNQMQISFFTKEENGYFLRDSIYMNNNPLLWPKIISLVLNLNLTINARSNNELTQNYQYSVSWP